MADTELQGDLFEAERAQVVEVVEPEPVEVETAEERAIRIDSLKQDEQVIESGLSTFRDVGWALMRIRDGKKYRDLPEEYKSFEDYCQKRWDFNRAQGYRLMAAADMSAALSPKGDIPGPTRETQVRELMPLKDDPDALQAAWAGAVELAGGGQPSQKQVREVVEQHREPEPVGTGVQARQHPAPFSTAILRVIHSLLEDRSKVLDPFAGTGRIHLLSEYGFETVGVEIEPAWAEMDERTEVGTALKLRFRKGTFDAVATSPTYGNRLADSYDATDPDRRHSYHFDLGRVPSEGSSAVMQWGDEYRAFHEKAWKEATRVLKANGRLIVNIKDHIRDGEWQDVAAWHVSTIVRLGYTVAAIRPVGTKGIPSGTNSDIRSEAELVIAFDRIEQ